MDMIIAVGAMDAGFTPPMPFVAQRLDGGKCMGLARLMTEIALIRCGFDISDMGAPITDVQELVLNANRIGADCIAVLSCGAFGSRKSFNDISGATIKYAAGRLSDRSRVLAEDVCAKVALTKPCITAAEHKFDGAACPAIEIAPGYLTDFDEAKLLHDPDYIHTLVEYAVMGICEYFGMPYIPHSPAAYKRFKARLGMRGKSVKLLQAALGMGGYHVNIDGVFGKHTDIAAKECAINNGFSDDEMLNGLLFVKPQKLSANSRNNAALYIQRKLKAKLYYADDSGVLSTDTIAAANDFLTETEHEELCNDSFISQEVFELIAEIGGGRPRLF